MTFYNIIFGILFFGAIRELLISIVERDWVKLFMAFSLTICVFNDTIYTSHYIEKDTKLYTIQMKLLDLLNFLILGTSLIILSPQNNIFYSADKLTVSINKLPPWLFWALLVAYWILALFWNRLAERALNSNSQDTDWLSRWIFIFPLSSFFASLTPWPSVHLTVNIFCAVMLFIYMTLYKLIEERRNMRRREKSAR